MSTTESWAWAAIIGKTAGSAFSRLSQLSYLTRCCCFARSRSWFPVVYDEYLVKPTENFDYAFWFVPLLTKDSDASVSARHAIDLEKQRPKRTSLLRK